MSEKLLIGGAQGASGEVVTATGADGTVVWGPGPTSAGTLAGNGMIPYEPWNQDILLSEICKLEL